MERRAWYLKKWSLIGVFQASSGSPFTPVIAGDPLGTLSSDPYDVPNRQRGCGNPVHPHQPLSYLNAQCFAFPDPVNLLGDVARNSVVGPDLRTLDLSLFKETPIRRISSAFNIQARFEIFNILNLLTIATSSTPLGNQVDGAGQIDATTTPSQQVQLGLKTTW